MSQRDFPAAIAYLVRRLDENTSPDNFLAHLFDLADDASVFDREAERFAAAVRGRNTVDRRPRRRQDRRRAHEPRPLDAPFVNAADTDWTRAANRVWIDDELRRAHRTAPVPAVTVADVDVAVAAAEAAQETWWDLGARARAAIIDRVGDRFEVKRYRLAARFKLVYLFS